MAEVTLPQLGETVTEGTITRWFKKVGDTVALDEPLFEVSTDKVDTEVPSPIAGVLTEIRVPEGETVPVGAVIGVVGDAGAVVAAPAAAPAPVVEAAPAPVAAAPAPVVTPAPAPVVAAPVSAPATGNDNRLLSPVVRRLVNEHNLAVDSIAGTGPGGRITREDVLDHID
jgi:2-oxoglutarate dehydrogenase E2 component (dihydrolipoamide succinyltransferase)